MELDKTTLTHQVAEELWKVMDPFGTKAPFEEQDPMVQFNLKAKVLPVVNLTIPHAVKMAEDQIKDKLIGIINTGRENKHTDEEILLALTMELS